MDCIDAKENVAVGDNVESCSSGIQPSFPASNIHFIIYTRIVNKTQSEQSCMVGRAAHGC